MLEVQEVPEDAPEYEEHQEHPKGWVCLRLGDSEGTEKVQLLTGGQSFCLSGRNFVDLPSLVDEAALDHLEVQVTSDFCVEQHLYQLTCRGLAQSHTGTAAAPTQQTLPRAQFPQQPRGKLGLKQPRQAGICQLFHCSSPEHNPPMP